MLPGAEVTIAHALVAIGGLFALLSFSVAGAVGSDRLPRHPSESHRLQGGGTSLNQRIEELHDLKWQFSESETLFRGLLDAQDDLITRRSEDGRLTYANRAYLRTFGLDKSQAIGSFFEPSIITPAEQVDISPPLGRRRFQEQIVTIWGARWIEWEERDVEPAMGHGREI